MNNLEEYRERMNQLADRAADLQIEDYYRALLAMREEIDVRLECADSDGIDLRELRHE